MTNNDNLPFKEGTKLYRVFIILSDQQWHCGKHELPGTQPAKAIQIIRQNGFEVENKTIYCSTCSDKTVHRRLISTEPANVSFVRLPIPEMLRKRILKLFNNTEAITLRELLPNQLEVDHRFPQVRWSEDEHFDTKMSDDEIRKRFQLLTRENNLWKSRYCERCEQTGIRGTFIGINYFFVGQQKWNSEIPPDDEQGCIGCFWHDPSTWRALLNEVLSQSGEDK